MSSLGRVITGECAFTQKLEYVPDATVWHSEALPGRGRTAQMSQPGLLGNFSAALILPTKPPVCQYPKLLSSSDWNSVGKGCSRLMNKFLPDVIFLCCPEWRPLAKCLLVLDTTSHQRNARKELQWKRRKEPDESADMVPPNRHKDSLLLSSHLLPCP